LAIKRISSLKISKAAIKAASFQGKALPWYSTVLNDLELLTLSASTAAMALFSLASKASIFFFQSSALILFD
jgi:hypothetical protein